MVNRIGNAGIANNVMMGVIGAVVAVIIVAVVLVVMQPGGDGPGPVGTYTVSGYAKSGGVALEGVTVTLGGLSTTTGSDGYYTFTGLAGNTNYTLTLSKSGYELQSSTIQVGTQDTAVTDISLKAETAAMPLAAIKSAIASQQGASASDVELYFTTPAAESDYYAAGAVIGQQESVVYIYQESTGTVTVENSYTASTTDEQAGMTTLADKQVISRFTSYRIVPFNVAKVGSTYTFDYFDSYDMYLQRWGFGSGLIDANGDVPEDSMTHTWLASSAARAIDIVLTF